MMLVRVATPEDILLAKEQTEELDLRLLTLNAREAHVVRSRYSEEPPTYKQLAKQLGVCGQRVRDIEHKALRKLAHPCRTLEQYRAQVQTSHAQAYRNLHIPQWKHDEIEAAVLALQEKEWRAQQRQKRAEEKAAREDARRFAELHDMNKRAEYVANEARREAAALAEEIVRLRRITDEEARLAAKRQQDAHRHMIECNAAALRERERRERGFDLPPHEVAAYGRSLIEMLARYREMWR